MFARTAKPPSTKPASSKPTSTKQASTMPAKNAVEKIIPDRRMANAEKFAGGRGGVTGVLRYEKRGNGRVRTSRVSTNLGDVQDLSLTGCRLCAHRKSKLEVGQSVTVEFAAEDVSVNLHASVVWVRVMTDRSFHVGLRFNDADGARRKSLLELLRTGVANEGLSRGWSPMAGFSEARLWED